MQNRVADPTIGPPPPDAPSCLTQSRKDKYKGGTLIDEAAISYEVHRRHLARPGACRPARCPRCGGGRLHVHDRPARHPRGDPDLPETIVLIRFICANQACEATWRMVPAFLARHLWHSWKAVGRVSHPEAKEVAEWKVRPIAKRTANRWRSRLMASALVIVILFAMSGISQLEAMAIAAGHRGTRAALVEVTAQGLAISKPSVKLAKVAALAHRLEAGVRLM